MRSRNLALLFIFALVGCGISFHPDRDGQTFPQTVKMATRLSHRGPSSCSIGTITFAGSLDDRWEEVARLAASNGGTHYFVSHGGGAGRSERARYYSDEQNVIVVYRSEPETCDLHD